MPIGQVVCAQQGTSEIVTVELDDDNEADYTCRALMMNDSILATSGHLDMRISFHSTRRQELSIATLF